MFGNFLNWLSRSTGDSLPPQEANAATPDGFDTRNEYRIVADTFNGYEVQYRAPKGSGFTEWRQCGGLGRGTNTHSSIERAENFARQHAKNGGVEKFLGRLP